MTANVLPDATVQYTGYEAKRAASGRPAWRRLLAAPWRFVKRDLVYNTLLYPYGAWRHAQLLASAERSQSHTYTCFRRAPLQLDAITGPVLRHIGHGVVPQRLRVLVFACSTGAEAYTLAATLRQRHPGLAVRIEASDLHQEMIDKATAGRYTREEVLHSPYITPAFIDQTFDRDGDDFVVKPEVRAMVAFRRADLLSPELPKQFEPADVVLAQNVLFHLSPTQATVAFGHVASLLKPRGALLLEGMDLALKVQLTRARQLRPLAWACRAIYEQSRVHVSAAWWRHYWGSEPYALWRRERVRRYSSIFLRG